MEHFCPQDYVWQQRALVLVCLWGVQSGGKGQLLQQVEALAQVCLSQDGLCFWVKSPKILSRVLVYWCTYTHVQTAELLWAPLLGKITLELERRFTVLEVCLIYMGSGMQYQLLSWPMCPKGEPVKAGRVEHHPQGTFAWRQDSWVLGQTGKNGRGVKAGEKDFFWTDGLSRGINNNRPARTV